MLESRAMTDQKTKATEASVSAYLDARATEEQRADCKVLMAMLEKVTKQGPKMWGPSIVGFGSYEYTYDSGRSGESCLAGFALRGKQTVIYLVADSKEQELLLPKLGKHTMGKSCLYFKRLGDLDLSVLEQLIAAAVIEVKRRYGAVRGA